MLRLLFFMVAIMAATPSFATLSLAPVRIELSASQPAGSLVVRNDGDQARLMQVKAVSWSQSRGRNEYEPTRELIINPPIFTVAPGSSQLVRIGLRRPVQSERELAYRIYLTEVGSRQGERGVSILLRFGIPVFVKPSGPVQPVLRWQAQRIEEGGLRLSLHNEGRRHLQVSEILLHSGDDGSVLGRSREMVYVLAGQSGHWDLNPEHALDVRAVRVVASTSQGAVTQDLEVLLP